MGSQQTARISRAAYLSTDSFYYRLRAAIENAQEDIDLAYYVVSNRPDRPTNPAAVLFHRLADAAASRVTVRLIIPAFNHVKSNKRTASEIARRGIIIRTMPNHKPLHLKFALIDNSRLFVGSHNLCRKSFERNVEAAAEIWDPASLIDAARDFREWWAASRAVTMGTP